MARTRAQEKARSNGGTSPMVSTPKTSKAKGSSNQKDRTKSTAKKRQQAEDDPKVAKEGPSHKKHKTNNQADLTQKAEVREAPITANPKLRSILSSYGTLLLEDLRISDPVSPTPKNILALVLNAMLTSARISHQLAFKSVKCLIEAEYHDIEVLKRSTWEERTKVLTNGGYTRYREKTATELGDLVNLVQDKYGGDLNNLLKRASSSPPKIRTFLKEIKGLGDVGIDIFFDTAQGVWSCLAPFIDPRSLKTAERIGLENNVDKMWRSLGEDAVEMCRLSAALTTIRLEKKEKELS